MKNHFFIRFLVFLVSCLSLCGAGELREVIVSHTDDSGILQLFRMKEDGTGRVQLTKSKSGCRMPSVSPDGRRLLYVEPEKGSLSLWVSDIDGRNARVLVGEAVSYTHLTLPTKA